VIVIDAELQDMDWFEVLRELRARRPESRFLALTRAADDRTLFTAFSASADGVVDKGAGVASIVDAIERVATGSRVFAPEHERRAMRELGRLVRSARESTATLLTAREVEVLQLLAEGMTHQVVARRLRISPRTVETHVRKTYRKLGVHNRVQAIREAASLGVVRID
jgi:DNA-binding NarL/FixJ family response regulator